MKKTQPACYLFLLATLLTGMGAAQERPNIIFFLSDDHRWDRMGCAGHPFLQTPTMDRLAAGGVRFSNMFVTTSICAASRATLFTGLHERTHGYTFGTPPISQAHRDGSYPARLKAAGYRTGFVGKFGVAVEGNQPHPTLFDFYAPLNRNPYFKEQPDGSRRHVSEIAGDKAVEFINGARKDQPFCLSVSFNAPHAEDRDQVPGTGHYPWPKAVDGLYEDVEIPAPRLSDPAIFNAHPDFLKTSMNRERFFWRWDTKKKYETNLRAYYRMITGLDRVMGRVLGELEKRGLDQNTVVIFSGDNGYYEGQRGFAGKWSHFEESLRVPLIIHDPRADQKERGRVDEHMALNTDVAPTILAYAGVKPPAHYQGHSLLPLMRGEDPADWRTDTFCEHLMDNAGIPKWEGVRAGRFVYARYFEKDNHEFLHDLEKDPDQLTNIASDPAMQPVLDLMRMRCDYLRDEYGGPFDPARVNNWKLARAEKAKKNKAAATGKPATTGKPAAAQPVQAARPKLTPIFNGKDLTGWHGHNPHQTARKSGDERFAAIGAQQPEFQAHWTVENGELVNDGHGPYATTEKIYGDIEFTVDYRTVARADSGIYLRGAPQVQIWDTTDEGKWKIGADKGSGGLWNNSAGTPGKDPLAKADKPFGEWNAFRIRQVGARTWVWLNGQLVVNRAIMENYWDKTRATPLPARGPIHLQTHGGEIRWRNIAAREIGAEEANRLLREGEEKLGFEPVFNGKDFNGWAGPTANYEVIDGAIRCQKGKGGTIYTEASYDDFVVRLEFKVPPGGNNGLAIRYPGKGNPAYDGMCELQVLDNTAEHYAKLDQRQYHGSAYGIVAAHRGYLRPPNQWNFQEVTVRGSTIRVELNGTVILDADLARTKRYLAGSPHPGKDLTSGHFGFAGHSDPVQFRRISIKRLKPE